MDRKWAYVLIRYVEARRAEGLSLQKAVWDNLEALRHSMVSQPKTISSQPHKVE